MRTISRWMLGWQLVAEPGGLLCLWRAQGAEGSPQLLRSIALRLPWAKTTRRQRSPRTSSGYVRSLACLAARRAGEPGWRPCRRGSPVLVKGETRVVSTASCAPLYRGSPCAMASIRRLSSLLVVVTLRSVTRTCVRTLAPASLHTRAAARSRGPALLRNAPDVAHAARWSPKESRGRRHRQ